MKSILELLATIMSIPHVDTATKTRAGFIKSKLDGSSDLYSLFGIVR